jgi:hypothetical protein
MFRKGFISTIVVIVIALALLYYFFDWSIFEFASSERGQKTIEYTKDVLVLTWSYLKVPISFLWDKLIELIQAFRKD